MPRTVSARLEDDLEERYEAAEEAAPEENKSAFLRSVVADGLDAKDRDVLDAIDASEELRAAVEARREEGEPLDDAARRLLRVGVAAAEPTKRSPRDRLLTAVGGIGIAGVTAAAFWYAGPVGAVLAVVLWGLVFAFGDLVGAAVGRFESWAVDVLEEEAARNRPR
jgi:hypothetical protein